MFIITADLLNAMLYSILNNALLTIDTFNSKAPT